MKKIILLLFILSFTFGMVACNKDNSTEQKKGNIETEKETIVSEDEKETEETEEKIDLMYTFKDPSKPVAFNYPNLKSIEEGTSQVFKNSKYVIAYCRDSGNSTLEDIPTVLADKFYNATSTHLEGTFEKFSISSTEELTVNQTNILKINGYVVSTYDDGSTINLPMQGYTFVKGDTICELIAVLSEESNDVNQTEMEETIEAMINTLREDR